MQNSNERPVCHRAEDLVTYMYGEATAEEARDFADHLKQCDACRAEYTLFNQVHEWIVAWRNEALGSIVMPQREVTSTAAQPVFIADDSSPRERKLSALAALREFFSVSPLWLRSATAFAGLLLCALIVFAVSRTWQPSTPVANDNRAISQQEFQRAVQREVEARLAEVARKQNKEETGPVGTAQEKEPQLPVATTRSRRKTQTAKLTRAESEQLAADLGLLPIREEDLPFVLPDEPNQ